MPIAAIPTNESARVTALRDLAILDTGRERAYDDITRLAAHVCKTPISVVTFVDTTRQWFKSSVGTVSEGTDRDASFCAHTILADELLEVRDATSDPRFADNPLVTGPPRIRFYAGMPLRTSGGHNVGALCVIDMKPRRLTGDQRDALASLARAVSHFLELRHAARLLQQSLEEVRLLTGLIPICMHCKNIRSDEGFWRTVERYVENNSNARFSHCICPPCLEEHYGEMMVSP